MHFSYLGDRAEMFCDFHPGRNVLTVHMKVVRLFLNNPKYVFKQKKVS